METPNEYLKRISPNDKYGIREHLQKERLRGVVENIMQKYAEYYHQQQLLIHSVVKSLPTKEIIDYLERSEDFYIDDSEIANRFYNAALDDVKYFIKKEEEKLK